MNTPTPTPSSSADTADDSLKQQIADLLNTRISRLFEQVTDVLWTIADQAADEGSMPQIDHMRLTVERQHDQRDNYGRDVYRITVAPRGQKHLTDHQHKVYVQWMSEGLEARDIFWEWVDARAARAAHYAAPEEITHIEKDLGRTIDLPTRCDNCNGLLNQAMSADRRCLCNETVDDHTAGIILATIGEMADTGLPTSLDALTGSLRWTPETIETALHVLQRDQLVQTDSHNHWHITEHANLATLTTGNGEPTANGRPNDISVAEPNTPEQSMPDTVVEELFMVSDTIAGELGCDAAEELTILIEQDGWLDDGPPRWMFNIRVHAPTGSWIHPDYDDKITDAADHMWIYGSGPSEDALDQWLQTHANTNGDAHISLHIRRPDNGNGGSGSTNDNPDGDPSSTSVQPRSEYAVEFHCTEDGFIEWHHPEWNFDQLPTLDNFELTSHFEELNGHPNVDDIVLHLKVTTADVPVNNTIRSDALANEGYLNPDGYHQSPPTHVRRTLRFTAPEGLTQQQQHNIVQTAAGLAQNLGAEVHDVGHIDDLTLLVFTSDNIVVLTDQPNTNEPHEDVDHPKPSLRKSDRTDAARKTAQLHNTSPRQTYTWIDHGYDGNELTSEAWHNMVEAFAYDPDGDWQDKVDAVEWAATLLQATPMHVEATEAPAAFHDNTLQCEDCWQDTIETIVEITDPNTVDTDDGGSFTDAAIRTSFDTVGGYAIRSLNRIPHWMNCSICGTTISPKAR